MGYSAAAHGTSATSSKDSGKQCSNQGDCEHYSFPKSTLAAITSRVVSTEIDRQDLKTFRSPNAARAFPTNERYMKREDISKFNTLLEEVVWMCDVVLHNRIADHVWARFFRDGRYHRAITSIFGYVREFVWSLVDRESPGAVMPLWQSKRLKIQMVLSACPIQPVSRNADVLYTTNTIHFYPNWIHGWKEGESYEVSHELAAITKAEADVYRIYRTRTGILLHELVHYVSNLKWDAICSSIHYRGSKNPFMWRNLYHIPDVVAVDYADRQSKTDQEILRFFQKTKSENTVDLTSSDYHTAYGVPAAMKLATLSKSGALAATLNADNYLSFAAELCAVYLSYEPATDPSLCIKDILGRVPTPTEDRPPPW